MSSKNAYVWVIFKGDRYIPGVLVSAYSIKRTNTKHDTVCLVTPDVSLKGRKELLKVCDKVIEVDYIQIKQPKLKTKRQELLYKAWISISYTKWHVLNLTQYKKIFLLDADTIVSKNIDKIFNQKRIGGTFYNPWSNKYTKHSTIKDFYKQKKIITPNLIQKALTKSGHVLIASAVLLHPNKNYFKNFKIMLQNNNVVDSFSKNNYSGHDEQSIAYFMSIYKNGPQLSWYNLPQCYQFIPWHRNQCCDIKSIDFKRQKTTICSKISVIHFFGFELPWELDFNSSTLYPDIYVWLAMCQEMLKKTKVNIKNINIKYPESIFKKINTNTKEFKIFTNELIPSLH